MVGKLYVAPSGSPLNNLNMKNIGNVGIPNAPFIAPAIHHWIVYHQPLVDEIPLPKMFTNMIFLSFRDSISYYTPSTPLPQPRGSPPSHAFR